MHTKKAREGWIIPGAHRLKHQTVSPKAAKIITADGHKVEAQVNDPSAAAGMEGTAYHGQYSGVRVFEPLVLYHYVERGTSGLSSWVRIVFCADSNACQPDLEVGKGCPAFFCSRSDGYTAATAQDCYRKLKVAQKLRKGGWRDKAGSEGCKK